MPTYKTPDVYVEEISVFPPSVAEVGTAIPAFVGYTAKALNEKGESLSLKPTKIRSLAEYEQFFGGAKPSKLALTVTAADGGGFSVGALDETVPAYLLWYSLKMYFDNGGSVAYVVSVKEYQDDNSKDKGDLLKGLATVAKEDEPTLLLIPDAVWLSLADYGEVCQKMLAQCEALGDRFAVFDVYARNDQGDWIHPSVNMEAVRGQFGMSGLKYGAAYHPFLRTTLNPQIGDGAGITVSGPANVDLLLTGEANEEVQLQATLKDLLGSTGHSGVRSAVQAWLRGHRVLLPPGGAIAGVYAAVDGARGVWKAPANRSVRNVIAPVVAIDNPIQDDLNVDATSGKSINALRAFAGKGTLVWGARTLAGNDNEWRYVPVRRFFNMVEESVKKSTYWAVFEPNDANTWIKVRGMIENYLTDKWRDGALAGATPKDAFFVKCGLGTTMTSQDILEGRLIVEIGMAAVRPAEFIVLRFSHKLQTS